MVLKPVKKKRVLKPVVKKSSSSNDFERRLLSLDHNLTCKWHEGFPLRPERKTSYIIREESELAWLAEQMMNIPAFSYDTETNGLRALAPNKDFKLVDITISWGEDFNFDIPVGHVRDEDIDNQLTIDVVIEYLKPVFEREDVIIFGQNLKFDLHVLRRVGVKVVTPYLFDIMLASWLCDENTPNGLKENSAAKMYVSQEHFKEAVDSVPNSVKKQFGLAANSKATFDMVLIEDGADYAMDDSFFTWCLAFGFIGLLRDEGMNTIFYKMYVPFMSVLLDMEEKGTTVNVERLQQMGEEMQKDLDDLQYRIYEIAGVEFNVGSSQQCAEILFGWRKPDKPITMNKIPKEVQKVYDKLKAGDIDKDEAQVMLNKKNFYYDENGKVWKKSNVNEDILSHSFNFAVISTTDGGMPQTNADTLWRIAQKEYSGKANSRKRQGVEMCNLMLDYAKLDKLKTAFVDGILEQIYDDGKAHPSFNQIGTDSGRLSCSKPNLQQLPNADEEDKYQIRDMFIGSEYVADAYTGQYLREYDGGEIDEETEYVDRKHIIAIDYHNLEMVCLTHFSGDKNLTEMFANDDDAHGSTAVNMFNLDCTPTEAKKKYPHLRQAAKTINFMLMYGGGAGKLYDKLRLDRYSPLDLGAKEYLEAYHCKNGKQVAQAFIDRYFDSYSGVASFIRRQKKNAHRQLYVNTILGRKRRLPEINSSDGAVSSYCERLAVNSAIQGTAGDITINAQIRVAKEKRLEEMGCFMLIQVHDELVFECPECYLEEAISIIKYDMEHPFGDSAEKQVQFLRADPGTGLTYQEAK